MRPELMNGSLSADTKNHGLALRVASWVSSVSKLVEIMQNFEGAGSRDGSLILGIEDRVASCICFALDWQKGKSDTQSSLGRLRAKYRFTAVWILCLLQSFQEIFGFDLGEPLRLECIDYNGGAKTNGDVRARRLDRKYASLERLG